MRFNASQKYTLIKSIFGEEFDVKVLVDADVLGAADHFMMHTKAKTAILESWRKHRVALIRNMLYGDFTKHMEPIILIADYFGEK